MSLCITDFEATCWNYRPRNPTQEIIEIGCVRIDPETLDEIDSICVLIKPKYNPKLSKFCTRLTNITQEMIDSQGVKFGEGLSKWAATIKPDDVFCSWGDFDRKILMNNCKLFRNPYPFRTRHINIKPFIGRVMINAGKMWEKTGCGLATAVQRVNLTFEGVQHRGIDDARNIVNVMREIQAILDYSGEEISLGKKLVEMSKANKADWMSFSQGENDGTNQGN